MEHTQASGTCLCGTVSFCAGLPSKWVAHCHCSMCQRAHGAAFVTWVSIDASHLMIDDNAGMLRWFASSAHAQRGFCSRCGSTLFFRSSRWPGEVHVARANFTTPVDRRPQLHAYYDSHVDWFTVGDALPTKAAPDDD